MGHLRKSIKNDGKLFINVERVGHNIAAGIRKLRIDRYYQSIINYLIFGDCAGLQVSLPIPEPKSKQA